MSENLPQGFIDVLKTYQVPLILGGLSLVAITISIILLVKSTQVATPIQFSSDHTASESSVLGESVLKVDIEGAVVHPGLYSLPEGSRVEDAILAAGGLSNGVHQETFAKTINRAMKLVDGAKLFIPSRSDDILTGTTSQTDQASALISVNTATENQLDMLPGVGPVTAGKIIDNRPYQTLEELVSKKALGQALFDKIKSRISL